MNESTRVVIRREFRKLLPADYDRDFDARPLAELGVDSLDFFETIMILEEDYGIVIPIEKLESSVTVDDLVAVSETQ